MSEKRFELDVRLDMPKLLIDNATNKRYHLLLVNDIEEIVDLLNEQQATISQLKEENEQLKHYKLYEDNKRLQTIIADLKEENEQLRKELKEIKENPINYF